MSLTARDGSCPIKLLPVSGAIKDSILFIPFANKTLDGVRFDAPTASLDRTKFTHLEFWVASSREWPSRDHWDLPVRIWLTHQVKPGPGDDNNTAEEDFSLIQTYLPGQHLHRRWQKVSIPIDELYQSSLPINSDPAHLFLKFMVDHSWATAGIDTSRRADLFLSGVRWAKYPAGPRVTTRQTGVVIFGEANAIPNYGSTRIDLRLLNPTAKALWSDSLRIRLPYWSPYAVTDNFGNNTVGMGTDESVLSNWFSPMDSAKDMALAVDSWKRKANHTHSIQWRTHDSLKAGKGWEAIWSIGYSDSLFRQGMSMQHFAPDSSPSFSLMGGVVAEYGAGGHWKRLWGYDASEDPDTVNFWGGEALRIPSDTAMPSGAVVSLGGSCVDTSTKSSSNTYLSPGDPNVLPSSGRDPLLTTQVVNEGGQTALKVTQSGPNFNIQHDFVFDTAWAHHNIVDVDVYVDPNEMVGSAWAGDLAMATFDGNSWLTPVPVGNNGLQQAVGQWVTLRFQYNPTSYVLGKPFTLLLEANGHGNGTNAFQFDIGTIRLEGASSSGSGSGGTSGGSTGGTGSATNGKSLDSLSQLTSCNQCVVVSDSGRKAIAVTPTGGGTALAFSGQHSL